MFLHVNRLTHVSTSAAISRRLELELGLRAGPAHSADVEAFSSSFKQEAEILQGF
jgi:hypothetical protein